MLNSYTVLLNRGPQKRLTMIPPTDIWPGETSDVVLLDGTLVRAHIENRHGHMCWLSANSYKISALQTSLNNGIQNLEMPIYNFTGGGQFDDLEIEGGRHRTYLLIEFLGVDFLPVLVPGSLAPKFRRLFGFRNGYLTLTEHREVRALKVIESQNFWYIGTDLERESVETFNSKAEAESALNTGQWNERPAI